MTSTITPALEAVPVAAGEPVAVPRPGGPTAGCAALTLAVLAVAVTDPADVPRKVEVLRRATTAADQMARDGRLMTLPASPEVAEWRAWVADELVEQATKARRPCSFSEFRSRR